MCFGPRHGGGGLVAGERHGRADLQTSSVIWLLPTCSHHRVCVLRFIFSLLSVNNTVDLLYLVSESEATLTARCMDVVFF